MAELKTVIFDFDGTLHDCARIYPDVFRTVYAQMVEEGWAQPRDFTDEQAMKNIGLTAHEVWATLCPTAPEDVRRKAAAKVGERMDAMIRDGEARLFDGVPEMLDGVRQLGVSLVFLSNCRIAYQEAARTAFGLDRWFDGYYNSEEAGGIPKEEIFPSIAQKFPGAYTMVGDRKKDLAVSVTHGFPSVGCLYGYGSREELADATFLAETPADVVRCLQDIQRQL
jgi:phosphoglycolate phosphatase